MKITGTQVRSFPLISYALLPSTHNHSLAHLIAVAASLLGCLFVFSLGTVLMNLLVGILTKSLDKVS